MFAMAFSVIYTPSLPNFGPKYKTNRAKTIPFSMRVYKSFTSGGIFFFIWSQIRQKSVV
jgi:hypothetical protein